MLVLKEQLDDLTPEKGTRHLISQMIPCTLNFETRMGVNHISLVLQNFLSNSTKGTLEEAKKTSKE